MHFEGSFETKATPRQVYDFVMNPQAISKCLPDLQKLEVKDQDHFNAAVKVGIGFIKDTFNFRLVLVEKQPPKKARLKAHGTGARSTIDIDAVMNLEETQTGTRMSWQSEARVGGLIASVGQRIMGEAAEKIINQLFDCLRRQLK